jgi:nucleoside-diphosphate-sugar epimerase
MQTILGANGAIANNLVRVLPAYTDKIRLVSRNPQRVSPATEVMGADLLDAVQTDQAVAGSDIVYLTAGLPYNIKVWREQWPVLMNNVIEACTRHSAKLVFFSNVYPYGRVQGWMTEETPFNPVSKKGEVRAKIELRLLEQVREGNLQAMIVRGADFYGPATPLSFLTMMLFENYAKKKNAQWLMRDDVRHSFTYTPDAGNAMALLGNTPHAYNQVWHAPTDGNVLTGKEFISLTAKAYGVQPDYLVLKKWMVRLGGLMDGNIREVVEMLYQNDAEYLFDSSKFEKTFGVSPTSYAEGIAETVRAYR